MVNQDRYQRGWERLKEIDGEAGEGVIDNLKDIAPDFARYHIESRSEISAPVPGPFKSSFAAPEFHAAPVI